MCVMLKLSCQTYMNNSRQKENQDLLQSHHKSRRSRRLSGGRSNWTELQNTQLVITVTQQQVFKAIWQKAASPSCISPPRSCAGRQRHVTMGRHMCPACGPGTWIPSNTYFLRQPFLHSSPVFPTHTYTKTKCDLKQDYSSNLLGRIACMECIDAAYSTNKCRYDKKIDQSDSLLAPSYAEF